MTLSVAARMALYAANKSAAPPSKERNEPATQRDEDAARVRRAKAKPPTE